MENIKWCITVLNRIKSWQQTHQVENNGLVKNIRDSLNDYEARLHNLRAMIQKAAAQAKQAAGLNHENERVLGTIKVSFAARSLLLSLKVGWGSRELCYEQSGTAWCPSGCNSNSDPTGPRLKCKTKTISTPQLPAKILNLTHAQSLPKCLSLPLAECWRNNIAK